MQQQGVALDQSESQSQTVDFDMHDSDDEAIQKAQGLVDDLEDERIRSVKNAKKGKTPTRRRFTVDFNEMDDAILYRVTGDEDNDFEQVASAGQERFVDVVGTNAEDWFEGLQDAVKSTRATVRDFASQLKTLGEENEALRADANTVKEKYTLSKTKLKEIEGRLAASESDAIRIRQLRDKYRESSRILQDQNKILTMQLKKATQGQPQDPYDSDEEPTGPVQPRIRTTQATLDAQDTVAPGRNKNYPDAVVFDGDRAKWEQWKSHILSKFKQSAYWFPTEEYKIDYIRDKCTLQAYSVIQPRISPKSEDPYVTHEQVLADLEENFGDHDKKGQAEADMQAPGFPMRAKDRNESFDTFHTRFAATIAPLGYSEDHKIRDLRRYISADLRQQVTNGVKPGSYREFVSRLRTCDLEMRQNASLDAQAKALQGNRGSQGNRGEGRGGRGDNRGSRGNRGRGRGGRGGSNPSWSAEKHSWPPHVFTQIQKKGLCLKCLKPNHWATECKSEKQLTLTEAESRLAAAGIEHEIEAKPDTPAPATESEN